MSGLESRLSALRTEMEQRHEYLNGRINRSRDAEQNLREQADRDQQQRRVDPLPAGMKMPKLSRIDAKSDQALRKWFRQLTAYLLAYQMDGRDSRAVFFASQHFDGALESWWQSCVEETSNPVSAGFESVEALAEAAYKQFNGRDLADIARDKLDSVRQTGSVRSYANIVRENLVYLPHRSEGDNIHTFKRGLKPALAQALALRKPTSLSQAIEMALEVEAAQRVQPTRQAAPTKKDVRSSEHLNALDGTESDETGDLSGDEPSEGDEGHVSEGGEDIDIANVSSVKKANNSTKERWRRENRCLKCGQKGHYAKACTSKKKTSGEV